MIGNPFLTYYNATGIDSPLQMGTLEKEIVDGRWTGKWNLNTTGNIRYLVEPVDNGWSEYRQVAITTIDNLEPFTCYFVQVGGNDPQQPQGIDFATSNIQRASIVAKANNSDEYNEPIWFGITMSNANGEADNTALLISNDFTTDYDVMDDLIKMRGAYYQYYSKPVVATRNDYGEMAFNALPDDDAASGVPVNYFAAANGQYTIAVDDRYDISRIEEATLFDADNSQWHNLLLSDYTFSSTRQDNKSRLSLFVKVRRTPQIATDTERLGDDQWTHVRLISQQGILTIRGVTMGTCVWVYSADGKLAYHNTHAADNATITLSLPTGVYYIRLANELTATTLKTIVR